MFEDEFKDVVLRIQEQKSFSSRSESECHVCGDALPYMSYYRLLFTDTANHYCYHCMSRVCSAKCLAEEKIAVPMRFHFMFDCSPQTVCPPSLKHMKKFQRLVLIKDTDPQVRLHPELLKFYKRRLDLNALFDSITCETWQNIIERNGFAAMKNLVLKDCYLTLEQLPDLKNQVLHKNLESMIALLEAHFTLHRGGKNSQKACTECVLNSQVCEVCFGRFGKPFFEYQLSIAKRCDKCEIIGHNECI